MKKANYNKEIDGLTIRDCRKNSIKERNGYKYNVDFEEQNVNYDFTDFEIVEYYLPLFELSDNYMFFITRNYENGKHNRYLVYKYIGIHPSDENGELISLGEKESSCIKIDFEELKKIKK